MTMLNFLAEESSTSLKDGNFDNMNLIRKPSYRSIYQESFERPASLRRYSSLSSSTSSDSCTCCDRVATNVTSHQPQTASSSSSGLFDGADIWKPSVKESFISKPRYLSRWNSEPTTTNTPFNLPSPPATTSIWSPRPRIAISAPLLSDKASQDGMSTITKNRLNHTQSCCYDCNPNQSPLTLARYFVIKSYNENDVHKSFLHGVWTSTELGNRRLDAAYRECQKYNASLILFFSVNSSGQFCGVAEMTSTVDYNQSSGIWQQEKWKSLFNVRWIFINDIPNIQFRHLLVQNNDNKPVTNSRDTQELLPYIGIEVFNIFRNNNNYKLKDNQ